MLKKLLAHAGIILVYGSTLSFGASNPRKAVKISDLPAEAQSKISATLGLDTPEYHVRNTHDGYEAENPRQGIRSYFNCSRVETRISRNNWRIALRSYGYGDTNTVYPPQTPPRSNGNRVEYDRGLIKEWYVNGPLGLEQGFTLLSRPTGKANGQRLRIALDFSGNLVPVQHENSLSLAPADGHPVLVYGAPFAWDTKHKLLETSITLKKNEILLEVDDSAAEYPLTVDPTIQNFTFKASDGVPRDGLGISVAIDGNTVVVGAYASTYNNSPGPGAAYVFVRPSSGWTNMTQTAKLTASDGQENDYFGYSVGVSGNTVVVGAPRATIDGNQEQGASYVFVKPPNGWVNMTQTAKLISSDGTSVNEFGNSVAISGNTVIAGAPFGANGNGGGTAYVFVEPNGGWMDMSQTAALTPSDGMAGDYFGFAVSVSADTVIVGGGQCPSCAGSAYVFVEPSGGWTDMTETAELTPSDGEGEEEFGLSVGISGNTAVVGDPLHGSEETGAVYIFVKPAGGWSNMTQTAELLAGDIQGGCVGNSVSVSGSVVLAGAYCTHGYTGVSYVFVKPIGGWKNTSRSSYTLSIPFSYQTDYFGWSVAVSDTTGIIGAPYAPTSPGCNHGKCSPGPGEAFLFTENKN